MYANLKVTIEGRPEPVAAYSVEVKPDGSTLVNLDGNTDGMSSYYEHAGDILVAPGVRVEISADF